VRLRPSGERGEIVLRELQMAYDLKHKRWQNACRQEPGSGSIDPIVRNGHLIELRDFSTPPSLGADTPCYSQVSGGNSGVYRST
jgi:hypothetical protein